MPAQYNITTVIPTYNRADSLARAIDSVLHQDYPVGEIIVVDDGSTDGTAEMIKKRYGVLVNYLYQPNRGVSHARNTGISQAAGEWIALLDSDDQWMPEKIRYQVAALSEQPAFRLCHTEELWVRNGRRVNPMKKHRKFGGDIFRQCLPLCVISPSSVLIRRDVFSDVGMFDESLPACEDYDYWLRYCARYPVLFVNRALLQKYGGHDDQLSKKHWGMDRFRVRALQKILLENILSAEYNNAVVEAIYNKCRILEAGAIKHGNRELIHWCETVKKFAASPQWQAAGELQ